MAVKRDRTRARFEEGGPVREGNQERRGHGDAAWQRRPVRCEPPFVLTPENALAYFDPSSAPRDTPESGAITLVRLAGIRQRLAALPREQSDARFLAARQGLIGP